MSRRLLLVLVAVTFSLAGPTVAGAKAPSKRDVDEALLRMTVDQLEALRSAEAARAAGAARLETIQAKLDVAWLDSKATKAWVDAGESILRAIKTQQKAAQTGNRTEELASLASQTVRSEASLVWRKERATAAKMGVSFRQTAQTWGKSELERLEQAVELERLRAYDVALGGDPDVAQEVGRAQTKLGRLAGGVDKERLKMERAEAEWQQAVAKAAVLDPSATK